MVLTRLSYARLAVIGVSGVVFIAATMMAGVLFGQRAASPFTEAAGGPGPEPSPTAPGAGAEADEQASPVEFVDFRDEETGFAVSYPATWVPRSQSNSRVRFLVSSPDNQSSAMVQVVPFDREATRSRLTEQGGELTEQELNQTVAEGIVTDDEDAQVLVGPEPVQLAGQRATYFLYAFDASDSDERGVHARYFLVGSERIMMLVLESIPAARFSELTDVFDRIAGSFELLSPEASGS